MGKVIIIIYILIISSYSKSDEFLKQIEIVRTLLSNNCFYNNKNIMEPFSSLSKDLENHGYNKIKKNEKIVFTNNSDTIEVNTKPAVYKQIDGLFAYLSIKKYVEGQKKIEVYFITKPEDIRFVIYTFKEDMTIKITCFETKDKKYEILYYKPSKYFLETEPFRVEILP